MAEGYWRGSEWAVSLKADQTWDLRVFRILCASLMSLLYLIFTENVLLLSSLHVILVIVVSLLQFYYVSFLSLRSMPLTLKITRYII